MPQRSVRTKVPLHARPLDAFVRAAREFTCNVRVTYGPKSADGKNVLQLLILGVPKGAEIRLEATGVDEDEALETLSGQIGVAADEAPPLQVLPRTSTSGDDGVIRGVAGAPGSGVGIACWRARFFDELGTDAESPEIEQGRLHRALELAEEVTAELFAGDDPFCDIFRGQQTMLGDPALRHDLEREINECERSAVGAVSTVFAALEQEFEGLESTFAADRHADVADVRDRLLEALSRSSQQADETDKPIVLLVAEATPSRLATLDPGHVRAVVSERGGPTSHAAIVARGRGIPLVFIPGEQLKSITQGDWLLVDGDQGLLEPISEDEVRRRQPTRLERPVGNATAVCTTADGHSVHLRVNLGAPGELALAARVGAEGCGLLRTELLFAGRLEAPSVEDQADAYGRVAGTLSPHPLVVRLFDAGSDKPLAFLQPEAPEANPALGLRGVRLLLRHQAVLEDQLKAVAMAREKSGDVRVMVPMVNDVDEVDRVIAFLPDGVPLGVMIETPAAALLARSLSRRASFFSIGSNDLAQYTLAADRSSGDHQILHPAELMLIARAAEAATTAGIECGLCGELAADPRIAPLLVGVGVSALSMAPPRIPLVRAAIRQRAHTELEELARRALALSDPRELSKLIDIELT